MINIFKILKTDYHLILMESFYEIISNWLILDGSWSSDIL